MYLFSNIIVLDGLKMNRVGEQISYFVNIIGEIGTKVNLIT